MVSKELRNVNSNFAGGLYFISGEEKKKQLLW